MKPQDILFIVIFLFLLWRRKPRLMVLAGLSCLLIAIPLFQLWIFFTAQHLVWYAAAFFLAAVFLNTIDLKNK